MAYTKNATVDSWDTAKQLEYYKANPAEAQQEIARANSVGGAAAANWASQLQSGMPAQTTQAPSTPAYSGQSSVIGNVSNSSNPASSYQSFYDSVRASNPGQNQVNAWTDSNTGNVYNTTSMTPQQTYALMLSKDSTKNASAILGGMGLDANGNAKPSSPTYTPQLSSSQQSATDWINNPSSGMGGMTDYVKMQQAKYYQALASGDKTMLDNLTSDMQRVGYSLNQSSGQSQGSTTGATGSSGTTGGPQYTGTNPAAGSSAQQYIEQLNAAKLQANMAALGKSRDSALSSLSQEKAGIQPTYYQKRNEAAAGSQQASRNFAEFLQARGGTSSGVAAQAELGRLNSLQGNIGSLNRQENAALDDVSRRTTGIENAYQSDVASAVAGGEADKMNSLLNQYNADRNFNYTASQDAINNARQSKIDNWNAYMQSVGLTGNMGTGAKADWSLLGGTNGEPTFEAKTSYLQQEGLRINNEIAQLELANLPAEQKLKIQQLQKQISEIGRAPYQSAVDAEYDKIKLDTAREQLKQLQTGKTPKQAAEETAKMDKEKTGLTNALKNGDVGYSDAQKQIKEDLALGFYTKEQAAELLQLLETWASNSYGNRWNG